MIRFVQAFFIEGESYYELKWLLLGEWLNQGFKMYSETFDYTGPIAAFVYKYLYFIFGRSSFIHYGVSSALIIFQAGIFNQLLLKNKAYDENSYLPAFLYVMLMLAVPDFMTLSPQLLSLTFVLMSLRNVLRRIDNQVTDELFLNSGIYLGIATMIYLPSMIFFFVFLFALILFSTAVTRRLLLYLFSFFLAFSLCALYFYWRGDVSIFIDSYVIQNILLDANSSINLSEFLLISGGFILIFILSVFKTWGSARLTSFQQKIQQVIWLMFFGGVVTFFLSNEKSLHEIVFTIPAIAYFWTHYFILLKRRIFQFLMPGILVFGLLFYSIYAYLNFLSPLQVDEKKSEPKLMILGGDLSYYTQEKVLTPCFNEHLSRRAFEGLEYYHSAGELYKLFQKASPNVIVDNLGVMPDVRRRFPSVESAYVKTNDVRYEKINN
ncbi:hypothetical protein [Ekhidna sp.]|uniref:hypothetical protein n=1 Tax=Ekhidna sp. TaxID=2608089 RepID=UPI003B5C0D43